MIRLYDLFLCILDAISFSDALSGAAGVLVTLLLTYLWRRGDKRDQIRALRRALQIELLDVSAYYLHCTEGIEDKEKMLSFSTLHLQQSYTPVYDANAEILGVLKEDTAAATVRAYTALKVLTDMLNSYASVCAKHQHANIHNAQDAALYQSCAEILRKNIVEQQAETMSAIDAAVEKLS